MPRAAPRSRWVAAAFPVTVRELTGAERDTAWTDIVLVRCPPFGKYEQKTTRKMPLALLTPTP